MDKKIHESLEEQPPYRANIPLSELERALFLEMREAHTACHSLLWPDNHPLAGKCMKCLHITNEEFPLPLEVREDERFQVFFYKLRDGRVFGTTQGIWNMN